MSLYPKLWHPIRCQTQQHLMGLSPRNVIQLEIQNMQSPCFRTKRYFSLPSKWKWLFSAIKGQRILKLSHWAGLPRLVFLALGHGANPASSKISSIYVALCTVTWIELESLHAVMIKSPKSSQARGNDNQTSKSVTSRPLISGRRSQRLDHFSF